MATVRLLHSTGGVTLGRFTLAPDHDRWGEVNEIGRGHHAAFPVTPVWIAHRPHAEVACDATQMVLYDDGARYRRRLLSPLGDTCLFLTVEAPVLEPTFRFPASMVSCPPATHLALHSLRRRLAAGMDGLDADVAVVELAHRVLATLGPPTPVRGRASLVEDTRALLALRYCEPLRLADIAREVGSSPFHLARLFRAHTGESLHGYRTALRLRHVVAATDGRLADVAVEAGFAHHSHLSERFRRYYGVPPSAVTGHRVS